MKNNKDKGRLPPFVPVFRETLESPAWKATSYGARLLYIALKSFYNGQSHNNGRIFLAHRKASEIIGAAKSSVAIWFHELEHYGFIVLVKRGHLGFDGDGQAPRWRLTEYGYMNDLPTRDFLRWDGVKFSDQENKIPHRKSVQGVPKIGAPAHRKSVHSVEPAHRKSVQMDGSGRTENRCRSIIPLGGVGGALTEEEATNLTLPRMTVVEGGKSAARTEGSSEVCAHCGRNGQVFKFKNGSRPVWLHRLCKRYWHAQGAAS